MLSSQTTNSATAATGDETEQPIHEGRAPSVSASPAVPQLDCDMVAPVDSTSQAAPIGGLVSSNTTEAGEDGPVDTSLAESTGEVTRAWVPPSKQDYVTQVAAEMMATPVTAMPLIQFTVVTPDELQASERRQTALFRREMQQAMSRDAVRTVVLEATVPIVNDTLGQRVNQAVEPVLDAIKRLDLRMDRFETRMDQFETRMGRFETRMDRLETRMDRLETGVTDVRVLAENMQRRARNSRHLQLDPAGPALPIIRLLKRHAGLGNGLPGFPPVDGPLPTVPVGQPVPQHFFPQSSDQLFSLTAPELNTLAILYNETFGIVGEVSLDAAKNFFQFWLTTA